MQILSNPKISMKVNETKFSIDLVAIEAMLLSTFRGHTTEYVNKEFRKFGMFVKSEDESSASNGRKSIAHQFDTLIKMHKVIPDNVPMVYCHFDIGGRTGYVMERVNGKTLHHYVESFFATPPSQLFTLTLELKQVVDTLHKSGLVHNDLHTKNIIIRNSNGKPVLIDPRPTIDILAGTASEIQSLMLFEKELAVHYDLARLDKAIRQLGRTYAPFPFRQALMLGERVLRK